MFDRTHAKKKAIVMSRSQNPQLYDLLMLSILHYNSFILYQISTSFLEEKSPTHFIELMPIKQNVWAQLY